MSARSQRILVREILESLQKEVEKEIRLAKLGNKETIERDREKLRRNGVLPPDWKPNDTIASHKYWDDWSKQVRQYVKRLERVGASELAGPLLEFSDRIDNRDEVTCESEFRFEQLADWLREAIACVCVSPRRRDAVNAAGGGQGDQGEAEYPTPENYPRDRWIYEERIHGKTITDIISELLQNTNKWEPLYSDNGVRDAIKRYCKYEGLAVPKGKPGRKPKSQA